MWNDEIRTGLLIPGTELAAPLRKELSLQVVGSLRQSGSSHRSCQRLRHCLNSCSFLLYLQVSPKSFGLLNTWKHSFAFPETSERS